MQVLVCIVCIIFLLPLILWVFTLLGVLFSMIAPWLIHIAIAVALIAWIARVIKAKLAN